MALLLRLRERYPHVPIHPPVISDDVQRALDIDVPVVSLAISSCLSERIRLDSIFDGLPQHKELFYLNDRPLPCVIESDYSTHDNWLTAQNYYPLYFNLYKNLVSRMDKVRMLEIGVRTGYQGVVFARACWHKTMAFFMGLDPNLYVNEGLSLAGKSLRSMRDNCSAFDFALQEGYSWERDVQNSLVYSGPYDIIHIDGDHSMQGKLIDLDLSRRLLAQDGVVLVDDVDHHPIIRDAIRRAITSGWFKEYFYVKTLRGLAILQ